MTRAIDRRYRLGEVPDAIRYLAEGHVRGKVVITLEACVPDISEATIDDAAGVAALWRACGLTRPWNDAARDFALAVEGATSAILLARDEGGLAAGVMVGFDGHRGWVYYLAVAPERRREGLGRALMAAAENWLRARHAPAIRLMVRDDNEGALGFYAALGYEVQKVATIGRRLDGQG